MNKNIYQTAKLPALSTAALFLTMAASQPRPAIGCEECQLRKTGTYLGKFTLMGNGTVRTWVKFGQNGKPASMGVTLSETALTGLPEKLKPGMMGVEYNMDLPKEAAVTGFDHIGIDWNPQGHVPKGIYTQPHFDIHFYLSTQAELNKITLKGSDLATSNKKPLAKFMPVDYIMPPGTSVPRMGAHAIDAKTPELNGQPFTHPFLYGFYNGNMNFVEPMITKAFLETKPNVTIPVKQPAAFQKRGYYPTSYSIKHDPVRQEITIALEGLTFRAGSGNVLVAQNRR